MDFATMFTDANIGIALALLGAALATTLAGMETTVFLN